MVTGKTNGYWLLVRRFSSLRIRRPLRSPKTIQKLGSMTSDVPEGSSISDSTMPSCRSPKADAKHKTVSSVFLAMWEKISASGFVDGSAFKLCKLGPQHKAATLVKPWAVTLGKTRCWGERVFPPVVSLVKGVDDKDVVQNEKSHKKTPCLKNTLEGQIKEIMASSGWVTWNIC